LEDAHKFSRRECHLACHQILCRKTAETAGEQRKNSQGFAVISGGRSSAIQDFRGRRAGGWLIILGKTARNSETAFADREH
jgi:hypothetical protein